jgi:hypothetical protein
MADMDEHEIAKTAASLMKLSPGFLPYPIFEQIARLVALPILEVIPLRLLNGKVEVLLIERPADDPLWPRALHTPGTVIRATDISIKEQKQWEPFRRIIEEELKATNVGPPQYVGIQLHESKRGIEQAQLYWVEVKGPPAIGKFYNAKQLPDRLIASQLDFIHLASQDFMNRSR